MNGQQLQCSIRRQLCGLACRALISLAAEHSRHDPTAGIPLPGQNRLDEA
jgi:hypothetical protein